MSSIACQFLSDISVRALCLDIATHTSARRSVFLFRSFVVRSVAFPWHPCRNPPLSRSGSSDLSFGRLQGSLISRPFVKLTHSVPYMFPSSLLPVLALFRRCASCAPVKYTAQCSRVGAEMPNWLCRRRRQRSAYVGLGALQKRT